MERVEPACPSNHNLDKDTCSCVKIPPKRKTVKKKLKLVQPKKAVTEKKKRCPKGFTRNKTTGECDPKGSKKPAAPKKVAQPVKRLKKKPAKKEPKKKTRKVATKIPFTRNTNDLVGLGLPFPWPAKKKCPKGSVRDRQEPNQCVPKSYVNELRWQRAIKRGPAKTRKKKAAPKNDKQKVVIKDVTPPDDRALSRAIKTLVEDKDIQTKGNKDLVEKSIPKIRAELARQKSFSPSINKKLVNMKESAQAYNIFGCGLKEAIQRKTVTRKRGGGGRTLKVRIGTKKNGQPDCATRKNQKAIDLLLRNLRASSTFDCKNVIAPVQVKSNCWFNTMFVTFFISDKGRKFFRFFRQLMIEGKQANGKAISPPRLADAFFMLNGCIEASYNQTKDNTVKDIAMAMDTNNVITAVVRAIPKTVRVRRQLDAIKGVGVANNPLAYYQDIIYYLGANVMRLVKVRTVDEYRDIITDKPSARPSNPPDVYAFVFHDDNTGRGSTVRPGESGEVKDKPEDFRIGNNTYVLDSAVVRDTKTRHFCSVLTCNGAQFGYDGASFSRMSKFNWKHLINTNKQWTFEGSDWNNVRGDPIWWNFRNGYQILFYYRTS